jgi:RNA recognition motif-containing protein
MHGQGTAAAAAAEKHPPPHKKEGSSMWEEGLAALHAASAAEESGLHASFRTDGTVVSGLTMNSAFGSIPLQPGELATEPFERPLSAPPPPGFGVGPEERTRKASEMILRLKQEDSNNHHTNSNSIHNNNSNNNDQDRHNSFTNLAAVLGTGLAQSMEDATHEREFENKEALNFHRQTRHAASRLMGAEPQVQQQPKSNADPTRGFPSSLSSPHKQEELLRGGGGGTTTPVQMYPGQSTHLPASNDIGMNVSEPPDSDHTQSGLETLLSSTAREFRPTPHAAETVQSNASSMSADITSRQAEGELKPFMWDVDFSTPSRTLAILHVSFLRVPDVRSSCETFGLLEGFRADFSSRGIYFLSYYDIRSAQYAALELQPILQRLSILQRSNEEVMVRYCLPLNSSSQFDDGQISISELPQQINEYTLRSMLTLYGSIRSIVPQSIGTYVCEFNNIQDAKQAQLELDSSQPFGPDAFVEMAIRNPALRKKGRELLTMIGRWRHGLNRRQAHTTGPETTRFQPETTRFQPPQTSRFQAPSSDPWRAMGQQQSIPSSLMSAPTEVVGMGAAYGGTGQSHHLQHVQQQHQQETTQLVLGPDGRYSVVQNQIPFSSFAPPGATAIDPRQQQLIQGPNGQIYLAPVPAQQASGQHMQFAQHITVQRGGGGGYPATIVTNGHTNNQPQEQQRRAPQTRNPYYTQVVTDGSSLSGRSHRSAYSTGTEGDKDTRHLLLDLDAVESGHDTRTSLMVRNIPNKYTQQMLLSEFEENGHGPGVIDFFYLPIDFKNRCNRGYAFINFVDYRDILPFHKRYFGKHWRTFNSDKICDITYARIQGKAAMLKRFENSALMEKDDEYKPLVFASNGPHKGQRLPFPDPATKNT